MTRYQRQDNDYQEDASSQRPDFVWLLIIVAIVVAAVYTIYDDNYPIRPGLDLSGGLQVLLEADLPEDADITTDDMMTARNIIAERINALGVSEPVVQLEGGNRRIIVELPGIENPEEAISLIQDTALLEFVDTGSQPLPEGFCIRTTHDEGPSRCELTEGRTITDIQQSPAPTYETVLTGEALESASVVTDNFNQPLVAFRMRPDGAEIFGEYTSNNIGQFLTIVLDKQVISSPQIQGAISNEGTISGQFSVEEAQHLALQLRYGSLPVPLRIESIRQIGATLGQQSIDASVTAGSIGLVVVLLFMLIYYRLPGLLADFALIIYALINFALFKRLGVTLTLPAITGFLLSTGMAVDANILVFERMKEEIRRGGDLSDAIDDGFDRAWTSIRDSNVATLVMCLILWGFGRNFGASIVQGFAITLAIGVMVSMFTAVTVTKTFVRLVIGRTVDWLKDKQGLLGI